MSASALKAEAILKALVSLTDAFNAHDLDRIMSHFAEDAVLEMPRGRDPWGTRFVGKTAVREDRLDASRGCRTSTTARKCTTSRVTLEYRSGRLPGPVRPGQKIRANGCDFY